MSSLRWQLFKNGTQYLLSGEDVAGWLVRLSSGRLASVVWLTPNGGKFTAVEIGKSATLPEARSLAEATYEKIMARQVEESLEGRRA